MLVGDRETGWKVLGRWRRLGNIADGERDRNDRGENRATQRGGSPPPPSRRRRTPARRLPVPFSHSSRSLARATKSGQVALLSICRRPMPGIPALSSSFYLLVTTWRSVTWRTSIAPSNAGVLPALRSRASRPTRTKSHRPASECPPVRAWPRARSAHPPAPGGC
jgi:hypothetical protein